MKKEVTMKENLIRKLKICRENYEKLCITTTYKEPKGYKWHHKRNCFCIAGSKTAFTTQIRMSHYRLGVCTHCMKRR